MSDGGATPHAAVARRRALHDGHRGRQRGGLDSTLGRFDAQPGRAARASSSGVVRTELSKVSEDGAAEEGSCKAAAPEAVRSSQQWLERELELSLRADDEEEQEAAAAEAPAPAPDYTGRRPTRARGGRTRRGVSQTCRRRRPRSDRARLTQCS